MRASPILLLLFALALSNCGNGDGRTTDTLSSEFDSVAEKQAFLERYVEFRHRYIELDYRVAFLDGSSGRLPGPTEWNLRIFATIPPEEVDLWVDGLNRSANTPALGWISEIPNALSDLNEFDWYEGSRRVVGVDLKLGRVLYWNLAL